MKLQTEHSRLLGYKAQTKNLKVDLAKAKARAVSDLNRTRTQARAMLNRAQTRERNTKRAAFMLRRQKDEKARKVAQTKIVTARLRKQDAHEQAIIKIATGKYRGAVERQFKMEKSKEEGGENELVEEEE